MSSYGSGLFLHEINLFLSDLFFLSFFTANNFLESLHLHSKYTDWHTVSDTVIFYFWFNLF